MVYLPTENPKFGKFWKALEPKMLVYFLTIWYILLQFGIFCGCLVHSFFFQFWYLGCTMKNLATLAPTPSPPKMLWFQPVLRIGSTRLALDKISVEIRSPHHFLNWFTKWEKKFIFIFSSYVCKMLSTNEAANKKKKTKTFTTN
jgi:hypothetical protein